MEARYRAPYSNYRCDECRYGDETTLGQGYITCRHVANAVNPFKQRSEWCNIWFRRDQKPAQPMPMEVENE